MSQPVTDEQAPLPSVFEQIENRIVSTALKSDDKALRYHCACILIKIALTRAVSFNCQMGRGRTTTGMVASSLVYSLLMTDLADELDDRGLTQSTVALDAEDEAGEGDTASRSAWGDDERDEDALLNGDYRVILQLVGVLPQGIVAKRLLDRTIDRMDGVQNLRS